MPARIESPYLTPKEAAQFLRVSTRALERWRIVKQGPVYRKNGNKLVLYRMSDLLAWVERDVRHPVEAA